MNFQHSGFTAVAGRLPALPSVFGMAARAAWWGNRTRSRPEAGVESLKPFSGPQYKGLRQTTLPIR